MIYSYFKNRYWIIYLILVLGALSLLYINRTDTIKNNTEVSIILAPHFDDAILGVGGLINHEEHQTIVASFFTGVPQNATSTAWDDSSGFGSSTVVHAARIEENKAAFKSQKYVQLLNYEYTDNEYGRDEDDVQLIQDISKDIQSLIATQSTNKKIKVYGPADFGQDITHPDHAVIHQAFIDMARSYPEGKVEFYVYEDYPYVARFIQQAPTSLQKHLEDKHELLFTKVEIPLAKVDVKAKIRAMRAYSSQIKAFTAHNIDITKDLEAYTNKRCSSGPCEVVYKVAL